MKSVIIINFYWKLDQLFFVCSPHQTHQREKLPILYPKIERKEKYVVIEICKEFKCARYYHHFSDVFLKLTVKLESKFCINVYENSIFKHENFTTKLVGLVTHRLRITVSVFAHKSEWIPNTIRYKLFMR